MEGLGSLVQFTLIPEGSKDSYIKAFGANQGVELVKTIEIPIADCSVNEYSPTPKTLRKR